MGSIPVFGDKELIQACKLLGFDVLSDRGKGGHKLAKHPTRKPLISRQYEHITICTAQEYCTLDYRQAIIREIMAFGFSKEQVICALKGDKKGLKKFNK
jgi:hypothetical protein